MPHGKDIDEKVTELVQLNDKELVELGLKYIKTNLSQTSNRLVENVCNNFKAGDVLSKEQKTLISIFVAFEELTRNK